MLHHVNSASSTHLVTAAALPQLGGWVAVITCVLNCTRICAHTRTVHIIQTQRTTVHTRWKKYATK